MRWYRRNLRPRPDNSETYHNFLMPVNRDIAAAADLLHSMDNYAESTQSVSKKQHSHLW